MKGFLGAWTLLIKSIGLPLAIASGLSVGKEGPSVHFAVCTGNVISRFFDKYKRNASKTREILTATAAAGVAVAFGSPIGGVLFSLEVRIWQLSLLVRPNAEHRRKWHHISLLKPFGGVTFALWLRLAYWRCVEPCPYCRFQLADAVQAMNPFRTGQLVMFQVQYDRTWHFFELIFFILLGVFGGLYGAFVIKWNLRVQAFRKKYLSQYPITETVILAGATALLCYPNMFLKINMTEMMEILFRECGGAHDYNGLCE